MNSNLLKIATFSVVLWLGLVAGAGAESGDFYQRLVQAANERTRHNVVYDGAYRRMDYPMGDVPGNIGVCTDVLIRSYRSAGIDLQEAVHRDMKQAFDRYPSQRRWGLTRTDPNIDHRRVPNLQTFFRRHGQSLPISQKGDNYRPGDVVTWTLPGNLPHIGIVVDQRSADGKRPLVVHNIGRGPKREDMLFDYPVTGHYRFGHNYRGHGRINTRR